MLRSMFLTTAIVGLATSASAQGAYINGTYTPVGSSITVPADGSLTLQGQPTLGTAYDAGHAAVDTMVGGQYQAIPEVPAIHGAYDQAAPAIHGTPYQASPAAPVIRDQTITASPGFSQTYTIPAGENATYNVVVPTPAPAVTYAQPAAPVYAAPAAAGWKARGVYVGARAGLTRVGKTDFTVAGEHGYPASRIRSAYDKRGYTGALVAGYGARTPQGWGYRVEVEGGYQKAEVDSHTVPGVGTFAGKDAFGDAKVLYGFVNVYGDVPITKRLALTAGGGVGVGKVKFDGYGVRGAGTALDDSATALGYHLDAGVTYQVTDTVALEALYRYQSFVDAEVRTENGNEQKLDLDSHSVLAGVRVGF